MSCLEAKIFPKNWIQNSIELEIIQLAQENGHEVLFTPPHHSDLPPIELVWAKIKSSVARQYSKDASLKDVRRRLEEEFKNLLTQEERFYSNDIATNK